MQITKREFLKKLGLAAAAGAAGAARGDEYVAAKVLMEQMVEDEKIDLFLHACDIDVVSVAGIHMGILLPWSLVDSWCGTMYPGYMNPKLALGEIAGGRPDFLKSVKHAVKVIGRDGVKMENRLIAEVME